METTGTGVAEPPLPRDIRQRLVLPPEALSGCVALVVGCGAIGRQAAHQLAAVGVPRMHLVDFDTVELHNCAGQGWRRSDVGRSKVRALADDLGAGAGAGETAVTFEDGRFRRSSVGRMVDELADNRRLAVFCCVDSIATRKFVFEGCRQWAAFFVDGRMSGGVIRVLSCASPATDGWYLDDPEVMFPAAEAFRGGCTVQSTIFSANIAAGLMLSSFSRRLRGFPVDDDVLLGLDSLELSVTDRRRRSAARAGARVGGSESAGTG